MTLRVQSFQHVFRTATADPAVGSDFVTTLPASLGDGTAHAAKSSIPASHMSQTRVRRGVAKPLATLATLFFVTATLHLGLIRTGETLSYFSDTESALGNLMVADPVEFTLDGPTQLDMSTGERYFIPSLIPTETSEPLQYGVLGFVTGGDSTLCSGLTILGTTTLLYSGPISSLVAGMSTSTGEVPFLITWSGGEMPSGVSCTVDFRFHARNADADVGQGYTDEKILAVQFYVPSQEPINLKTQNSERVIVNPEPAVLFGEEGSSTDSEMPGITGAEQGTSTEPIVDAPEQNGTSTSEAAAGDTEIPEALVQDLQPTVTTPIPPVEAPSSTPEAPLTPVEMPTSTTEDAPSA